MPGCTSSQLPRDTHVANVTTGLGGGVLRQQEAPRHCWQSQAGVATPIGVPNMGLQGLAFSAERAAAQKCDICSYSV